MLYTMIIEQTKDYPKRMYYNPETHTFRETEFASLPYVRHFLQPYGWIKESGTPPAVHWDVILMSDKDFCLGDEVRIRVIGVFKRNDGDYKYIAVEIARAIDDFEQLSDSEKADLSRLYPCVDAGEGWFGREEARKTIVKYIK